jgi:NAD(P)-dependent dehydrogenase (short-subunit alcohol dehydrogenase family)
VFANAGIPEFAPLDKFTEEHFDKLFDINVKETLNSLEEVSQAKLPPVATGVRTTKWKA